MSNYYYLVAQLPGFVFSQGTISQLPISYNVFEELCTRFLTGADLQALMGLTLEPPRMVVRTGSVFLDRWYDWERSLRLSMAVIRAQSMKKEFPGNEALLVTQDIQQIARTACGFDSPLEAELYLNIERLRVLGDLAPIDMFCADAIFAYGLRLRMAERIVQFNEENGMNAYRSIYEHILGESI